MHTELYLRGLELFNQQQFFDAHEALEDVWRAETGPPKLFLQGLVQVAVALHHHSTGNQVGARSVLRRARKNLSAYPDIYFDLELAKLRQSLEEWQTALDEGKPKPAFPKMQCGRTSNT